MTVCFFVMLKSPRAFSWRQLRWVPGNTCQFLHPLELPEAVLAPAGVTSQFWFGAGYCCMYVFTAGRILLGSITNGLAPNRNAAGKPATIVSPQVIPPEKSPLSSAALGTQPVRGTPRTSLFHSWLQKKNSLSFFTGPPRE